MKTLILTITLFSTQAFAGRPYMFEINGMTCAGFDTSNNLSCVSTASIRAAELQIKSLSLDIEKKELELAAMKEKAKKKK